MQVTKFLIRRLLLNSTVVLMLWSLSGITHRLSAEPGTLTIEMPMYANMAYVDLIKQAEQLAANTIKRHFSQNPSSSRIQVSIVGDRHGEITPLLVTIVSRTEWQRNPKLSVWTKYYRSSYALLQRHQVNEAIAIAMAPVQAQVTQLQDRVVRVQEAYDSGRLTGELAQQNLDALD